MVTAEVPSQTHADDIYRAAIALINDEWAEEGISPEVLQLDEERATFVNHCLAEGYSLKEAIAEAFAKYDAETLSDKTL